MGCFAVLVFVIRTEDMKFTTIPIGTIFIQADNFAQSVYKNSWFMAKTLPLLSHLLYPALIYHEEKLDKYLLT